MSYRLIHTITTGVRDTRHSDVCVTARTETMPQQLIQNILNGPGRVQPASPSEPLFCYNVLRIRGEELHVLSSIRGTATAGVLIAHHVVLRGEERSRIVEEDACATPAGVALLLELQHLWETERKGGETLLLPEKEAQLPGACPAVASCATWQVFSGGSENAKILLRDPYCKGCVIGVPAGVRVRDMLRLLHESDAQSPLLGWGNEFAVHCAGQQLPAARQRIVCAVDSPLLSLARQAHVATLKVLPGLHMSPDEPEKLQREKPMRASDAATTPEKEAIPEERGARDTPMASSNSISVYRFAEYPFEGFFAPGGESTVKRRTWRTWVVYVVPACLLPVVAVILYLTLRKGDDAPPPHFTQLPLPRQGASPSPPPQQRTMHLPLLPIEEDEKTDTESSQAAGEPSAPPEIANITRATETQEQRGQGSGEIPSDTTDVLDPLLTTETGIDEETEELQQDMDEPDIETGRKKPQVLYAGRALPASLVPKDSATIESGEYIINYRNSGAGNERFTRLTIPLQPGKTVLQLRRNAADTVSVTVKSGDAPQPGVPVLSYTVRKDGKLGAVKVQGQPAAAQIPYTDGKGKSVYVLLLPTLQARLQTIEYQNLPIPAGKLDITDIDSYIEFENRRLKLKLPEEATAEWVKMLSRQSSKLLPEVTVYLPDLGYINEARTRQPRGRGREYTVEFSQAENHYEVTVTRRFLFRPSICTDISDFADKFSGVSYLYYVLRQLSKAPSRERREKWVDSYLGLFKDADFIRYARKELLPECAELVPKNDALDAKLRERLLRPESGATLFRAFRNYLVQRVRKAYEVRRSEIVSKQQLLDIELVDVRLSKNNKLIWIFEVKPSP